MKKRWLVLWLGAVLNAPALMAADLKLGTVGQINVDSRLTISVVIDMRGRSVQEVSRSFLANPRDASRLTSRGKLTIPFDKLADPYRAMSVARVFPTDQLTEAGLVHVVTYDNETLGKIAEIYTGAARNSASIRRAGTVGEVSVTRDHRIIVTIPTEGLDLDSLGRAVLRRPGMVRRTVQGPNVVIDVEDLKDAYRGAVLKHLFHEDTFREDALRHRVVLNIETLHRLALWFTGDPNNWPVLKRASRKRGNGIIMGETIVIPRRLLGTWASLTDEDIAAETNGYPLAVTSRSRRGQIRVGQRLLIPNAVLSLWTRYMEGGEDATQEAANWYVYEGTTNGPLTYGLDGEGGYALYRLQRGEALYSSVVVRFTGILDASDVMEAARDILKRSRYRDARSLPVNAQIKIPMALLSPEWRPAGDPVRLAESAEERAVADLTQEVQQERRAARTRALDGVTVILDAGHGGRDPGALGSGGLTENEVVYDIMCRVMRELQTKTRAAVRVTIEDVKTGYEPSSAAVIRDNRDERLLTTPPYNNSNIVMSANLRWYIANAAVRSIADADGNLTNVVFASFHADALHASVRGAMLYVPSARHSTGRYVARESYRRYQEVQVRPTVSYSYSDRIRSQAMSEQFAKVLLQNLRSKRIEVHDRKPVRGYIIRGRRSRPWVPAIIRYNAAPTKLVVEIGNIKNRYDAANMRDPAWRQRFAEAYVNALVAHFGG